MKKAMPSGLLRREADTHHRLLKVNTGKSGGAAPTVRYKAVESAYIGQKPPSGSTNLER
jgi:hypothetical protein